VNGCVGGGRRCRKRGPSVGAQQGWDSISAWVTLLPPNRSANPHQSKRYPTAMLREGGLTGGAAPAIQELLVCQAAAVADALASAVACKLRPTGVPGHISARSSAPVPKQRCMQAELSRGMKCQLLWAKPPIFQPESQAGQAKCSWDAGSAYRHTASRWKGFLRTGPDGKSHT